MQQHRTAPPATLEAVLERIAYANEQTGYTVARVADLVVDIVPTGCRAGSGSTRPARCRCCPSERLRVEGRAAG